MNPKESLRAHFKALRAALSSQRREEAALSLKEHLHARGTILSFTSIGTEIDTALLNQHLAAQNRLFLVPYQADALLHVPLEKIDCILVPALAFDKNKQRLGYGKGWYDRFLSKANHIHTIGVGFREQLCEELPSDPWDIALKELLLF